jgi:pyridoxamine--pyruvate transaminase
MTSQDVKKPVITLSAGPVDAYPAVLRALGRTVTYDFDPYFQGVFERTAHKAAKALNTDQPPLILLGEPVLALEAAAASLLAADDVMLNLASGEYGKGFGYWAARYCKEVVEIEVPYNESISPDQVRTVLEQRPDIAVLSVCHHDTPSGTINPVNEIGALCREHDVLMIVDAVSSWGGMDVDPVTSQSDVFITGPNKCLGGTPGLSLVHVSDRAWNHIDANPNAPFASMLSMTDWRKAWSAAEKFPFTPSIAEVNGLDAALDLYLEEGPSAVWARHALTAGACRAGLKAMGMALWPATEDIASPTCTTVRVPDGLEDEAIRQASRDLYGVVFSAGRGSLVGKLIRIGHMGPVAEPVYATVAVTALGGAINSLGGSADVGAGVEAALAVIGEAGV